VSALIGLLLVRWTGTVKRRLLNESARDDLTQRFAQFLVAEAFWVELAFGGQTP
jgi:hypothetical protein